MITDKIALFLQLVQAQNIACTQLESDFSNLFRLDLGLRYRLYTDYDYSELERFILEHCHEAEILKFRDDFLLTYYIVRTGNIYLAVGPIRETVLPPAEIHKMMERKALPQKLFRDMEVYYGNVTIPPDMRMFESTLINIACNLFSEEYTFLEFQQSEEISFETQLGPERINKETSIAIESIEERYEMEELMLDAICSGDQTKALQYNSIFRNFKISPRSENTLLNEKNLAIVFNTLCRKAVQKGHVHPVYIDELSTRYAIQINLAHSVKELGSIQSDMIHKYCLLVRNHSMKNYSQLVKRCIAYIDFHYAEPLTLAFFADMCHVTKSYLSGLFKKEVGVNLTDYIHSVRIRRSLVLLNSTQIPIHVVAVSCGYIDVNYYIKMFKRQNGVSPKQYRSQMQKR